MEIDNIYTSQIYQDIILSSVVLLHICQIYLFFLPEVCSNCTVWTGLYSCKASMFFIREEL